MKVFIKILELDLIVIFAFFLHEGSLFARDAIFIDAKINDQPVRMVFDTGSEAIILYRQTAKRLHVKTIDTGPEEKPELGKALMGKTMPVKFEVLGTAGQAILRVLDPPPVKELKSEDGVLSWFVMRNNLLKIDASGHQLSFLNELPSNISEWTKIPLKKDSYTLVLQTPGNGAKDGAIAIDSGASGEIALSSTNWQKWKKENPESKATLTAFYMPGAGTVISEVMWAKKVEVGPVTLANVMIREANIAEIASVGGSEFEMSLSLDGLKRLNFIVDGKDGFAYFSPNPHEMNERISYNRAGALFIPLNTESVDLLAHVVKGSPANEAGIENGDILLAINSRDVTHWREGQPVGFGLLAEQPAGTKVALTLRRGDKQFETVITLRDILGPSVGTKP